MDAFMGNSRWILKKIRTLSDIEGPLVEIGAGDGRLCAKFQTAFPKRQIFAFDLAERPQHLADGVTWMRGNFFETLEELPTGMCVGSLILHHFSNGELLELGRRLREFRALVFCEPLRGRMSLGFSALAAPFAGEVTRHDMPASIRAGFRLGELARLLELKESDWAVTETTTWRGGLRFCAVRRT
ncbi:MAG: hypothetical protein ACKOAS_05710 [Verrucomicrobiota bacterium]